MAYFDDCFTQLLGHEGGYVHAPRDPGGETKWGISKRAYPSLDIAALTQDAAKRIYWRDYWLRCACDKLPQGLAFDVFDAAVNSGPVQAAKWLQAAVGTAQDGVIGPVTLAAVGRLPGAALQARMAGKRLEFMASLPTWPTFGRGWARRIAGNLQAVGA
jgi:lysozyme family protein